MTSDLETVVRLSAAKILEMSEEQRAVVLDRVRQRGLTITLTQDEAMITNRGPRLAILINRRLGYRYCGHASMEPDIEERKTQVRQIKEAVIATLKRHGGRVTNIHDFLPDDEARDFYEGDVYVNAEFKDDETATTAIQEIAEAWQFYGVLIDKDGKPAADDGRVIDSDGDEDREQDSDH